MRIRSTTALLFLCAGLTIAAHAAENPRRRPATTWDVSLAPEGEPGERFVMEGIVRSVDGRALPNAKVFVYHADSKGMYSGAGSGLGSLRSSALTPRAATGSARCSRAPTPEPRRTSTS